MWNREHNLLGSQPYNYQNNYSRIGTKKHCPPSLEPTPFVRFNCFSDTGTWENCSALLGGVGWGQIMGKLIQTTCSRPSPTQCWRSVRIASPEKEQRVIQCHNIPRDRRILMSKRASLNKQEGLCKFLYNHEIWPSCSWIQIFWKPKPVPNRVTILDNSKWLPLKNWLLHHASQPKVT